MNTEKPIRVLLADDNKVVRNGLATMLKANSGFEVVGEAVNGREAAELNRKTRPDVILMDISMPLMNGLEATRLILKDFPGTKVIILSSYGDDAYVESAAAFGASGYLLKQSASNVLPEAIREVHKGGTYCSPAVSKRFPKRQQESLDRKGLPKANVVQLSSREVEVLQLIAEGEANKQIAESLSISIKTVEKHREHLMRKLDIHDTAGLTRYAIETGIIESSVQLTIV